MSMLSLVKTAGKKSDEEGLWQRILSHGSYRKAGRVRWEKAQGTAGVQSRTAEMRAER